MIGFNIKIAGSDWDPKIKVPISDFPDAIKTKDQEVDETYPGLKLIKSFAFYQHPDFKRYSIDWGEYDWVCVFDGSIIGPDFDKLECVKQLEDQLLSL